MKAACGGEFDVSDLVYAHASEMRTCMPDEVRIGRVTRVHDDERAADVKVHGIGVVALIRERITMTVGGTKAVGSGVAGKAAIERFWAWERGHRGQGAEVRGEGEVASAGGGA